VDWSYNSLTEPERMLLARLSVFAGGFTLDAAEYVCSDAALDPVSVFDVLVSLIDKSLVVADRTEGRYGLLETIRQYAREKLLDIGDVDSVRARHGTFFARFAADRRDQRFGPDAALALDACDADHDNLRQALEWTIINQDTDAALALAVDLAGFWMTRGFNTEARAFVERILALPGGDESLRVRCTTSAAYLATFQLEERAADAFVSDALPRARRLGDPDLLAGILTAAATSNHFGGHFARGRTYAEEAVSVARSGSSVPQLASAAFRAGCIARDQGDVDAARSFAREALVTSRQLGFAVLIGMALTSQALLLSYFEQDHAGAADLLEEALEQHRKAGTRSPVMSEVVLYLGQEMLALGRTERARTLTEEGLQRARDNASLSMEILGLTYLGHVELAEGNLDEAASRYRQAITVAQTLHAPVRASAALHALGRFEAAAGRPDEAAQLLATVESALVDQDDPARFISPRLAPRHAETVADLRAALGEAAFVRAWSAGVSSSLDDAIDRVLAQS
jgi:tetratricopeptide (TPR) repeat protein